MKISQTALNLVVYFRSLGARLAVCSRPVRSSSRLKDYSRLDVRGKLVSVTTTGTRNIATCSRCAYYRVLCVCPDLPFNRSLARSLACSCLPSAYRERFLLNLRGRSIYTSAQFREAASRECGFIGPLAGGERRGRDTCARERETGSGRRAREQSTGWLHDEYKVKAARHFFFFPLTRPERLSSRACTSLPS